MTPSRRGVALALLASAFVGVLLIVPLLGETPWSWREIVGGDATVRLVLLRIRLPRVLLGLGAGGALAVAGVALQTLFRNPLAEPYTLGVASGASLGAVVALQLGVSATGLGLPAVGLAAFLGALAVTAVLLGLAGSRFGEESSGMLLAGVAISLSCSAAILFIQYLADWTKTFRMVRWMMGGLAVVGYDEVLWILGPLIGGAAVLALRRWELDLLLAGEEVAASRGVDLRRLRLDVLAAVSVMVGAVVAVAGPIGFVGLIVPHLLRRWVGHSHLRLLPAAFLGGGVFLALCDLAARRVMAPAELPVGVVTALLGGPFFLWVLLWRRRAG
ncbi:MAG: iron ABC transporter permease [Thermoanaerobaculia bacterium]